MHLHCVLPQVEKGYYQYHSKINSQRVKLSYCKDHWKKMRGEDEKS